MENGKSLYEILQVKRGASSEVIQAAYERLSVGLSTPGSEETENVLKALRHARDILTDPRQRDHYDARLRALDEPMIAVTDRETRRMSKSFWIYCVVGILIASISYNMWVSNKRAKMAAELERLKIESEIAAQRAETERQRHQMLEKLEQQENERKEALARAAASQELSRIQNDMKTLEYRDRQQALQEKMAQERIESERQRRELEAKRQQAISRAYGSYR